jgi:hypothetical protein
MLNCKITLPTTTTTTATNHYHQEQNGNNPYWLSSHKWVPVFALSRQMWTIPVVIIINNSNETKKFEFLLLCFPSSLLLFLFKLSVLKVVQLT